ncbi:MAG: carboxypeptidase-like regulatory domain-containing protein, partial [Longimicrobiales bacterium]
MHRALLLALTTMAVATTHAAAQRITGRVVEQTSGAPVAGAFVTVLAANGARLASFLTTEQGAFAFDLIVPGPYTLRSERIGHATAEAGPFDLSASDTIIVNIEAPAAAIALDAIEIRREGRCTVRPSAAAAAAKVWDEVRKALEITRFIIDCADLT